MARTGTNSIAKIFNKLGQSPTNVSTLTLRNLRVLWRVLWYPNDWCDGHKLWWLVLDVFDFNEQSSRARVHLTLIVPVHSEHPQLVQVLLLVVQVTNEADDALAMHCRYRKDLVVALQLLQVIDHLSVGALVQVGGLHSRYYARPTVLRYFEGTLERLEDGLIVVDVLDQQQQALSDKVAVAQLIVRQCQDNRILVLGL